MPFSARTGGQRNRVALCTASVTIRHGWLRLYLDEDVETRAPAWPAGSRLLLPVTNANLH
jgi:hypothetical protein